MRVFLVLHLYENDNLVSFLFTRTHFIVYNVHRNESQNNTTWEKMWKTHTISLTVVVDYKPTIKFCCWNIALSLTSFCLFDCVPFIAHAICFPFVSICTLAENRGREIQTHFDLIHMNHIVDTFAFRKWPIFLPLLIGANVSLNESCKAFIRH